MSSTLILPDEVAQIDAAVERQSIVDIAEAARWTEELKQIDSSLSLVWAPENATEFDCPGRWHVRKAIPGQLDAYWPLLTDAADVAAGRASQVGLYKGPGAWLLDALSANDMWNPRVHKTREEVARRHKEAKARSKQGETEQRRDEMALAHRAATRIRGDGGLTKRTDLLVPASIAADRKAKKAEEARRP